MRFLGWLFFYLLTFCIGYLLYPQIKAPMFKLIDNKDPFIRNIAFSNGESMRINLRDMKKEDMPASVELKKETEATLPDGSATMKFPIGKKLRPVRFEGNTVTLEDPEKKFLAEIPVTDSDFVEKALDNMVSRVQTTIGADVELIEKETNKSEQTVSKAPEKSATEKEASPTESSSDPDLSIKLPEGTLTDEQIIIAMKQFVKKEKVTEFKFEQISDWKAGAEEEIDGEKVQTGTITVSVESVFGSAEEKTAKAIIKNGRVTKMIWPKSGFEIE